VRRSQAGALAWLALTILASHDAPAAEPRPALCVYDFASPADEGALGKKLAEILRGHARRGGEYSLLVEIDREDVLEAHPFSPNLATPVTDVAAHARAHFQARLAAYGEVASLGGDRLQVRAKVIELADQGEPRERLARSYEAQNKHELVQVADQLLADLAGRPAPLRRDKPLPIEYAIASENLAPNPSFEEPDPKDRSTPARWLDASVKKQSAWADREDPKPGDRKCLVLHPDQGMAWSYGLIWYSDYIPVEQGAAYVLSMDLMSRGPAIIIWTKGYTDYGGERRNSYKYQKRFYPGQKGQWEHFRTEPFVPRHPAVKVEWVRVMLYAYLNAGQAFFDHVDLRKVRITSGATRKADFEDPTRKTEGWREKKVVEGDQDKEVKDPEEQAPKQEGAAAPK
jgi:hypothetical protein